MRATVTWCSCIASSRLDWVFGVARLISSASTRFAKIGPDWNRKIRWPVLLDEDVRAGDVRRHQVRRELDAVERAVDDVGDRPDEHRLAEAGHALEQHVAVREEPGQGLADQLALADDDLADLALDRRRPLGEGLGGDGVRADVRAASAVVPSVVVSMAASVDRRAVTGSGRAS